MKQTQQQWSGKLSFILASAGAAVGIGNIWRFPYIVGEQGGSAFILLYTLFVFAIGIPLLVAEIALGRSAGITLVDGLKKLSAKYKKPTVFANLGWFSLLTLLLILSFYSVVSGWVIYYFAISVFQSLPSHLGEIKIMWESLLLSYELQILLHAIFMVMTMVVVARGIMHGLERLNNILMPLLFIILIALVLYSAFFSGAFGKALEFLFHFDLSKINRSVALQALGQACFSLAVGAGAMFVYGSYLGKKVSIISSSFYVAIIQFAVGILAGLAIFPIIFAKNIGVESGPGLMFLAIPNAFAGVPFAGVLMSLFFCLLLFAAITSSINLAEPLVSTLSAKLSVSRAKASIITGVCSFLLGIPSVLSFNLLSEFKLFGTDIFDAIINVVMNFMLPIGGIGYALYATYVLSKKDSEQELATNKLYYTIWYFSAKYLVPITLIIILIT